MVSRTFPKKLLKQILKEAEKTYPEECCGMIVGKGGIEEARVIPVENLQQKYHEHDPGEFPRTARNGYFMDPTALLEIQKELRESGETILIFYHSHPDAAAVFSGEDKARALFEGEPVYPGVYYLVASVYAGKTADWKLFGWNDSRKEFIEMSRL